MKLLALVLLLFATAVSAQEVRTNRVWSLRLSVVTCGIDIRTARVAQVNEAGEISEWHHVNPDLFILQWNREFAPEIAAGGNEDYGLHDLLVDYAKTRYVIQLVGIGHTGKSFVKMFWASPVGLSEVRIPPAPGRDVARGWSEEEFDALNEWYQLHSISASNWFKEFKVLGHRSDKKLDLTIKIRGSACEETNEEDFATTSFGGN